MFASYGDTTGRRIRRDGISAGVAALLPGGRVYRRDEGHAAVRGFQDALGLAVNGIVGPLTWRALVSGMLSG